MAILETLQTYSLAQRSLFSFFKRFFGGVWVPFGELTLLRGEAKKEGHPPPHVQP
jgi:hypothetical protein